jgi:hypothetical protein
VWCEDGVLPSGNLCRGNLFAMARQALMPDSLHWLGITRIHKLVSMSDMKYDAITKSVSVESRRGCEVLVGVPGPGCVVCVCVCVCVNRVG